MRKPLLLLTLAMLWGLGNAWGQALDPSNLHIGPGLGTSCQTGCAGAPNLVPSTEFDIWNISNAQGHSLTNPVLLIIGIPNDSSGGTAAPGTITLTNAGHATAGTGALTDPGYFGGVNTPSGYAGSWVASDKEDVYSFLNLTGANNSNNWSNWAGSSGDPGASNFGIYVYSLNITGGLQEGSGVNVSFSSALPVGTMVIAYGCQDSANLNSYNPCTGNPNPFATPFTESGKAQAVPEPATSSLLGFGLLILAGFSMRRRLAG